MRQDKTLKVCANHVVDPLTRLALMPGSDRAKMWVAKDFAEGDAREEKFAARFKDSDEAAGFETAWEEARSLNSSAKTGSSPVKGGAASSSSAPSATSVAAPAKAAVADVSGPIPTLDSLDAIYGSGTFACMPLRCWKGNPLVIIQPPPPYVCALSRSSYAPAAGAAGSVAAVRYGKLTEAFKEEFGGVEPTV